MILFADSPDKFINSYSTDFKKDFLNLLSRRYIKILFNTILKNFLINFK